MLHVSGTFIIAIYAQSVKPLFNYQCALAMCTLFEEIARDSKVEGRLEGKLEGEAKGIVETGFDFGLSEIDILERLQNKLKVSFQKAQEYLEMFGKKTVI